MNGYDWVEWAVLFVFGVIFLACSCNAETPPPRKPCELALSACESLVNAQDAQITLLKAEVAAYRKRVDAGIQNTPITLYTALGGALAGGTIGLVREGVQQSLLQALTGAGIGALLGSMLEGLVK